MSTARAALSASAATSALNGFCARGARRDPRRVAPALPRAVPSEERCDVDALSKRKPLPSVIVGGLFVAEARVGSDRRVSASAKRSPNGETARLDVPDDDDDDVETRPAKARDRTLETTALANEAISMWLAAAVLGPLLDHQHSRFDVLHYHQPFTLNLAGGLARSVAEAAQRLPSGARGALAFFFQRETGILETAWWVPPLFGGAGVVIGLGHTLGDSLRLRVGALAETFEGVDKKTFLDECPGKPVTGWEPSPAATALAISCFATQYFFSGALATTTNNPFGDHVPRLAVDGVLAAWGIAAWWGFDRTAQGLVMACLTAVAGPVAEIGLINIAHLYAYASPDVLGVPTWIPWVYFCGAPAVGLLARAVRAEIRAALQLPAPTADVAPPPRKKAWRPPPRGFQLGGPRSEAGAPPTGAASVGARGHVRPRGKVTVLVEGGGGGGLDAKARAASTGAEKTKRNDPPEPPFSRASKPRAPPSTAARHSSVPRSASRPTGATATDARATGESRRDVGTDGDGAEEGKGEDGARGDGERDRRAARRDALRREVIALQQLKPRLELVLDELVREASGARAKGEGKEAER